jgi:type I restriction enzyme R subunit
MSTQPEAILESNLVDQLKGLGYHCVPIHHRDDIISNLKRQLEAFNNTQFSDKEFAATLNHLARGNVFEKAKLLSIAAAMQTNGQGEPPTEFKTGRPRHKKKELSMH